MSQTSDRTGTQSGNTTSVQRVSDQKLTVTRLFDAPVDLVFAAWTEADLFIRWWAPRSMGMTILSCDIDARTGGGYRIDYPNPQSDQPWSAFGKYLEVIPGQRLVWTIDESDHGQVTTVTFADHAGTTLVLLEECYPSAEAFNEGVEGTEAGLPESFTQLDELLTELLVG